VDINRNDRGKYLPVQFAVEDAGAFTMPWTATIACGRGSGQWQEIICAENRHHMPDPPAGWAKARFYAPCHGATVRFQRQVS
jgi:hypothetical protein